MICPKCGSDDWRLKSYDSYTDEFVYECSDCGVIIRRFREETITTNKSVTNNKQRTVTTNKSIEGNKHYDDFCGYNAMHHCPNCGSIMYSKIEDGQLHCDKCEMSSKLNNSNSIAKMCPNCYSKMTFQTNGDFICNKCGLISHTDTYLPYTVPYNSNLSISNNLSPNEITIEAEKITIADKTIGIQIDVSKQILDNTDSIVINGIKYVKERTQ